MNRVVPDLDVSLCIVLLHCVLYCCSKLESSEITSVIIYVTQLCCMPFAVDTSDLLLINIQRYLHSICMLLSHALPAALRYFKLLVMPPDLIGGALSDAFV